MKILIDTNVFLLLYTYNQKGVGIFDDLKKIESHLFLSNKIDEFYRNRDSNISVISSSIDKINFEITASSSFVHEFPEFNQLKRKVMNAIK